jgi:S1-C subfamily serine protease
MEPSNPYRPRVSRETRSLLTAGLVAVAALWLLARIRFPERPVTPNPVPSVLSQLASGPKYDDLANEIAQLYARLQPSLLALDTASADPGGLPTSHPAAGVRLRDDLVVTLIPSASDRDRWTDVSILGVDAASGLAVVRLPNVAPTTAPVPWTRRLPHQSRYVVATDVSPEGVSLRPVFVGSLDEVATPLWSEPVWAVPRRTDLAPGSFLFTSGAELVGLVIAHAGRLAIVPGETVLAEAERLIAAPPGPAGTIGIEVQDLTPPVASVTGAAIGAVVTWVDATGAARDQVMAGDVIEAIDGRTLATRQHWDVRVARLTAGETLRVRVNRRGEIREVALVATAAAVPPANRSLGLTLRAQSKVGAVVMRTERGSAADRAGLAPGDVIKLVGDVSAPTPAQVAGAYSSIGPGERLLVAVTRGDTHFVTTLER